MVNRHVMHARQGMAAGGVTDAFSLMLEIRQSRVGTANWKLIADVMFAVASTNRVIL